MEDPAGQQGGVDDEGDDVHHILYRALVAFERRPPGLLETLNAVEEALVARLAQVIICEGSNRGGIAETAQLSESMTVKSSTPCEDRRCRGFFPAEEAEACVVTVLEPIIRWLPRTWKRKRKIHEWLVETVW